MPGATIIDGAAVAKRRLAALKERMARPLGLGIIAATDDPATAKYVARKKQAAEGLGWHGELVRLGPTASQDQIIASIKRLNDDPAIDGLIVQLPLPSAVTESAVFGAVDPTKDADGLHPENLRRLYDGRPAIIPATPRGILTLLGEYKIPVADRNVTVVGQGNLTGRPLAALLEQRGAAVTRVDKSTTDLSAATRDADILVVATGNVDLITADMVKEGAAVIDVGINKLEAGITGDVDFEPVRRKASFITPVPGGVGPMTVASLLENVAELAEKQRQAG